MDYYFVSWTGIVPKMETTLAIKTEDGYKVGENGGLIIHGKDDGFPDNEHAAIMYARNRLMFEMVDENQMHARNGIGLELRDISQEESYDKKFKALIEMEKNLA